MLIPTSRCKGFTLIELALSIVLAFVAITGVFAVYLFFHGFFKSQENQVEMQQSLDWVTRDLGEYLKLSGAGLVDGLDGAKTFAPSSKKIIVVANTSGIVAKFKSSGASGATSVALDTLAGIAVSRYIGFYSFSSKTSSQHQVTSLNAGLKTVTFLPSLPQSYNVGDEASGYDSIHFWVDANMNLNRRFSLNTSQVVAENVENLKIEFFEPPGNLVDGPRDWNDIAGYRLTVAIRSAHKDSHYKDPDVGDQYHRLSRTVNITRRN